MTVRAAAAGPSPKLGGDAREPPRTRPAKRTCVGDPRALCYMSVPRAGQRRVTVESWAEACFSDLMPCKARTAWCQRTPQRNIGGPICAVVGIVPASTKPSICVDSLCKSRLFELPVIGQLCVRNAIQKGGTLDFLGATVS